MPLLRCSVEPLAAANANHFEIVCPAALGTFQTDRTKLKQSLLNLLGNAGKFTHDGRIKLDVRPAGGEISFIATDVSKSNQVAALVQKTVEQYGRIDCAVNNAARPARATRSRSRPPVDRPLAAPRSLRASGDTSRPPGSSRRAGPSKKAHGMLTPRRRSPCTRVRSVRPPGAR